MWLKCFISVFVLNTLLTAKVFWVWFSFTFSVILLVSNPKMIRTSGHVNRCHVRTDNCVLDRGFSQNVSDIQDNNSILSTRCTLHSFRKLSVFMVGLLHVSWLPIMTCILYIHEIILNLNIYYAYVQIPLKTQIVRKDQFLSCLVQPGVVYLQIFGLSSLEGAQSDCTSNNGYTLKCIGP